VRLRRGSGSSGVPDFDADAGEVHDWLRLALQEELTLLDASARTALATRIVTRF